MGNLGELVIQGQAFAIVTNVIFFVCSVLLDFSLQLYLSIVDLHVF
jgi:hypothetical protein